MITNAPVMITNGPNTPSGERSTNSASQIQRAPKMPSTTPTITRRSDRRVTQARMWRPRAPNANRIATSLRRVSTIWIITATRAIPATPVDAAARLAEKLVEVRAMGRRQVKEKLAEVGGAKKTKAGKKAKKKVRKTKGKKV